MLRIVKCCANHTIGRKGTSETRCPRTADHDYEACGYEGMEEADVRQVWERWQGKCWACGCPVTEVGGNQKRSHKWHGTEIAEKEAALLQQLKENDGNQGQLPRKGTDE
jgi:hypothetical protein